MCPLADWLTDRQTEQSLYTLLPMHGIKNQIDYFWPQGCYPGCRQAALVCSDKWFIWYDSLAGNYYRRPDKVANRYLRELLQLHFKVQLGWVQGISTYLQGQLYFKVQAKLCCSQWSGPASSLRRVCGKAGKWKWKWKWKTEMETLAR